MYKLLAVEVKVPLLKRVWTVALRVMQRIKSFRFDTRQIKRVVKFLGVFDKRKDSISCKLAISLRNSVQKKKKRTVAIAFELLISRYLDSLTEERDKVAEVIAFFPFSKRAFTHLAYARRTSTESIGALWRMHSYIRERTVYTTFVWYNTAFF